MKNAVTNFSLFNLLLLVAILAVSLAYYQARMELAAANVQLCELRSLSDEIQIKAPKKLHFRALRKTAPLVQQFQIAIPSGCNMELALVLGRRSTQRQKTLAAFPLFEGHPTNQMNQDRVTVHVLNTAEGFVIGCDGAGLSVKQTNHRGQIPWLDALIWKEMTEEYAGDVVLADPNAESTLYQYNETSDFRTKTNVKDPRYLRLTLRPVQNSGNSG